MVLNADKCHYMCLGKATENVKFSFDGNTCVNSKEEKVLGIIIDNDLLFYSHVKKVCKDFPKTSSVIWLRKLFRTGRKKINFQFHDKIAFHILPFSMGVLF